MSDEFHDVIEALGGCQAQDAPTSLEERVREAVGSPDVPEGFAQVYAAYRDGATAGLGVRRALVLGQILPGVPVWRLGPETRFPGLAYVVFPGNVGGPEALSEAQRRFIQSA